MLQLSGDRERAKDRRTRAFALAEMLDHPNSLAHALHNGAMGLQLVGDREATHAIASRAVALAEKFGLPLWRAGSLLLTGWATAIGAGVADAARLIEAEIDKATAVGPLPQFYLGLAAEVLLAAGRPPTASPISIAQSPRSTNLGSAFICPKSIACAANACWRSTETTKTRRGRHSSPPATSPISKAR